MVSMVGTVNMDSIRAEKQHWEAPEPKKYTKKNLMFGQAIRQDLLQEG